ncbi:hypothetical protein DFH28DRAFT_1039480 [Melampsora americana]|nr:hypothetical protein DFH28DRAFT_1039480 [Melampsora americana]
MGLDPSLGSISNYSIGRLCKNQSDLPPCIPLNVNRSQVKEYQSIKLIGGLQAAKDDFVLIKSLNAIGQVQSIWRLDGVSDTKTNLIIKLCERGPVNAFYGMREVKVTERTKLVNVKDIVCLLNIQHNCHDVKCALAKTHRKKIERTISTIGLWGVDHVVSPSFILNAASHYSGHIHQRLSDLDLPDILPEEWNIAINTGLKYWHTEASATK